MSSLIKLHIFYLCTLPMAGAFAALPVDYGSYLLRFGGWISGIVFVVVLLTQYQITEKKLKAVAIIALVPLELLLHIFYFKESIGTFFLEAACIEMLSMILALTLAMIIYRPSGLWGVFVGLCICAIVIFGYGEPLYTIYIQEGYELIWWLLLGGILLSGIWAHLQIFLPHARIWPDSRKIKLPAFIFNDNDYYMYSPFAGADLTGVIIFYIFFWLIFFVTPFSSLFITPPPGY